MSRIACPQCGAPIPAQSPQGLCPACLLKHGLEKGSATQIPTGGSLDRALEVTLDHTPGSATVSPPPERVLPEPGQRFGGYYILRTLGKGGMGAVYEADQIDTGRRLALKVLKHSLDSPEARKRFLREGRLAASVNHPNSVYVFGTEEIDGTPAITMELIAGGTLQQRVKEHGPLPIGAAVDTVLQIIAGLDAAQKAGILHRDIKPANCFIDTDGTVKVGDFGLSISTGPRGDTDLTQVGTLLGTPAFSSPEQLRGDELNMRSDIYSVGVTLYYLLTGRTPFEADNMVKLLATVLERPAESPRKWRPEIPRPLAAVLLRCLEKQPADRFRDYGELRQALLPFASTTPSPATLGFRLVASAVDLVFLWPLILLLQTDTLERLFNTQFLSGWLAAGLLAVEALVQVVYFGVMEGLWGLSPGKALCRLRVVGLDRAAPGIPRAAARAAIITLLREVPNWLEWMVGLDGNELLYFAAGAVSLGATLGMFVTARGSNGYAALHDLLTGTRVVSREAYQTRPSLAHADDLPEVPTASVQIGPYHVLQSLAEAGGEKWILGYDARLLRRVWIHTLPAGSPPVEASRRNLGRIGRLRWLTGRRSESEHWDAYEAASGQALVTLLGRRHPWSEVRFWLLDLAEELAAAAKDATVPVRLALDRIWITAEGRAKLLDFPAPGMISLPHNAGLVSPAAGDIAITGRFLGQVATSALEGRSARTDEAKSDVPVVPMPLRARELFASLSTFTSMEPAIQSLHELVRWPAEASRGRRLALVLGCCFPMLFLAIFGLLEVFITVRYERKNPEFVSMWKHLLVLESAKEISAAEWKAISSREEFSDQSQVLEALERYIAYRFGKIIQDRAAMSSGNAQPIVIDDPGLRALAVRVVAAHPDVSEAEFREAQKLIAPLQHELEARIPNASLFWIPGIFCFIVGWMICTSIFSLVAALLCRGGLLLWALGLAVARNDGAPASRLRVLGRALIAWSPILFIAVVGLFMAVVGLFIFDASPLRESWPRLRELSLIIAVGASLGVIFFAIAVWSALLPGRGIPDRLAGTWLVPR